ncbi:MAG: phosphoglycerate kinase [Pleomorphochaeta sp.]
MNSNLGFKSIEEIDVKNKKVLLRLDINSPIDVNTKRIVNTNRIDKSLRTLNYLKENGAKVAIIAHQGDTLDYQNLISLSEHASILSKKMNVNVDYIDDVCGPAAIEKVNNLKSGEFIILGNLRYLGEELSTFENSVKLSDEQLLSNYLVRSLTPHFDLYVNDAFSAAHRFAPSMVAFQRVLPSAAGYLFFDEISTLKKIKDNPISPCIFVLGGAKISDAFSMMEEVLSKNIADKILTCGVTGEVFLLAKGIYLGKKVEEFIKDRGLENFIKEAKKLLDKYEDKIVVPKDLAYEEDNQRKELLVNGELLDYLYADIGENTISTYKKIIFEAKTIFVNGPAGMYENPILENGTKELLIAISNSNGFSVVGGGDSVSATTKFTDLNKMDYICTAGGAMVRYLSGKKLPLITAMENSK